MSQHPCPALRSLPAIRMAGPLLLAATCACAAPPAQRAASTAPDTSGPIASKPPIEQPPGKDLPRPSQPGYEVPGSRIVVPTRMQPGSQATAKVPVGSIVEAFGTRTEATDGRVLLQAPTTPGRYDVRVTAPDRPPMKLVVEVATP